MKQKIPLLLVVLWTISVYGHRLHVLLQMVVQGCIAIGHYLVLVLQYHLCRNNALTLQKNPSGRDVVLIRNWVNLLDLEVQLHYDGHHQKILAVCQYHLIKFLLVMGDSLTVHYP
jgi:hypothetical protein